MDTVERLRLRIHTSEDETALTDEAADEIERLREALRKIAVTEPESDGSGDWWHMIIARAALKEGP